MELYGLQNIRLPTCSVYSLRLLEGISNRFLNQALWSREMWYCKKKHIDGVVIELYSLEMIIALAFRIRSEKAEVFSPPAAFNRHIQLSNGKFVLCAK